MAISCGSSSFKKSSCIQRKRPVEDCFYAVCSLSVPLAVVRPYLYQSPSERQAVAKWKSGVRCQKQISREGRRWEVESYSQIDLPFRKGGQFHQCPVRLEVWCAGTERRDCLEKGTWLQDKSRTRKKAANSGPRLAREVQKTATPGLRKDQAQGFLIPFWPDRQDQSWTMSGVMVLVRMAWPKTDTISADLVPPHPNHASPNLGLWPL